MKKNAERLLSDRKGQLAVNPSSTDKEARSPIDPSAIVRGLALVVEGMAPSGDALVMTFETASETPRVVLAQGVFAALNEKRPSRSFAAMHRSIANRPGAALVFDTDDSTRGDLGLANSVCGSIIVIGVDIGLEGSATAAIFLPIEMGRLAQRHVTALQSACALASAAAKAEDVAAPGRLQSQVRIETLESIVRETESFYRLLLNSVQQCYWVLDLDSRRVTRVSENFEEVWGAPPTILTQGGLTGFMTTVDAEDRDRVLSDFHTHLGERLDEEFRVVAANGETRWMWLRVTPVETDSGITTELVFIADDVTEKKSEEERARAKEAELISRARALAVVDLASGVAHEINNPLTIIVGKCAEIVRMAEKGTLTPERATQCAERIQTTSVRISEIVKSLKSLSRSEAQGVASALPLTTVAQEVADLASERFRMSGVQFEIVPPPADLIAEMNDTLVSQLVLNLVYNSLDAVRDLSEKWVRVDFSDDTDSVYIAVTDSGSGIPIKNRSRIFDPFFTTKPPGQGTGLGLSLATSIAAHHGGSIRLDTLCSRTRFVFQLPKRKP